MTTTTIEWTEAVWNPIVGCTVHSAGCTNCYAMRMAARLEAMANVGNESLAHYRGTTRKVNGNAVWTGKLGFSEAALIAPLKRKKPTRYFANSMSDLFHESVPDEWIDRVFAVMALAPQHTFQVLTKRSGRMREYCTDTETPFRIARAMATLDGPPDRPEELREVDGFPGYIVSSHGHIYSDKRGKRKRLSPTAGEAGHLRVPLFRDGSPRRGERLLVHRLVLHAFDGPPPTDDCQGRHLDGDAGNNVIGNLAWGDQSDNWQDSKRHGNFRRYSKLSADQVAAIRDRAAKGEAAYSIAKDFPVSDTQIRNILAGKQWVVEAPIQWPLPAVWLGVSVEDQRAADERIPDLLATPAAVRWLSCEPLIGPVDLNSLGVRSICDHEDAYTEWDTNATVCSECEEEPLLDWIVCGGESGHGARPMHPDWARSLRDQCGAAGVPFFFKQWGEWGCAASRPSGTPGRFAMMSRNPGGWSYQSAVEVDSYPRQYSQFGSLVLERTGKKQAGRLLDGREWSEYPA